MSDRKLRRIGSKASLVKNLIHMVENWRLRNCCCEVQFIFLVEEFLHFPKGLALFFVWKLSETSNVVFTH